MHRHLAITALVLLLSGCAILQSLGLDLDPYKPRVSFKSMDLRKIDFTKAEVDFVFTIDNPNPVSVKASSFAYTFALAGKQLMAGKQSDGLTLKAGGGSDVALPVAIKFTDVLAVGKAVQGVDKVGYALATTFGFTTPVGEVKVPVEHEGDFPMLHKPDVRLVGIRAKKANLLEQRVGLVLDVGVANKKGGSMLGFEALKWRLELGGKEAAMGTVAKLAGVPAGKEQIVQIPVDVKLLQLGTVVYNALVNRRPVDYRLAGDLQVLTPWGKAPLALDRGGKMPVTGPF